MNRNKFPAIFLASFFALPLAAVIIEKLFAMLFPSDFASQIIFAPAVEESGKIALFLFLAKKFSLDEKERRDANNVKLLLLIGFAFGLAENFLYSSAVFPAYSLLHFAERIITAQIFHTFIPSSFVLFEKKNKAFALLVPIALHSLWNSLIYFELNSIFVYLFGLLLAIFSIYKLLRIK